MKGKSKILLGASVVVAALAGFAYATPQKGLAGGVVGAGIQKNSVEVHGSAITTGEGFHVSLETEGPATITTTLTDYTAGGQNGWHSHPGMVIVTLTKGSIEWYDAECNLTVHNAGDTWMEGSQVHYLRVLGTVTTQFVSTFIVAEGQPNRIDEQAPPCAHALGLDQ
jgi:quercetin dioxygenase-like cupin family protein